MQAQQKVARKKLKSLVEKKLIVLVDGVHPEVDHLFTGRFYGQCPEIDGSILINGGFEHVKVGDFVEVQISDSLDYDLIGQALRPLSLEQKNQNTPDVTQKSGKRRPLQIL